MTNDAAQARGIRRPIPMFDPSIGKNAERNPTKNVIGKDKTKCQRNDPHTAVGALTTKIIGMHDIKKDPLMTPRTETNRGPRSFKPEGSEIISS